MNETFLFMFNPNPCLICRFWISSNFFVSFFLEVSSSIRLHKINRIFKYDDGAQILMSFENFKFLWSFPSFFMCLILFYILLHEQFHLQMHILNTKWYKLNVKCDLLSRSTKYWCASACAFLIVKNLWIHWFDALTSNFPHKNWDFIFPNVSKVVNLMMKRHKMIDEDILDGQYATHLHTNTYMHRLRAMTKKN